MEKTPSKEQVMAEFLMAAANGRSIPKEDRIFGISNRAKAAEAEFGKESVVNGVIGALLDDNGKLMILRSVDKVFRNLTMEEYASYAPIAGTPAFKKAAIEVALRGRRLKGFVEAAATPGGAGAIRNAVANYSSPGDSILTSDWHWPAYSTIAGEIGRGIDYFTLFNKDRAFNIEAFEEKVASMLRSQERLVVILNTPAHNPTGYSIKTAEWRSIVAVLNRMPASKKIALVVDAAYIDFAGDEMEQREFLPELDNLHANILPLIAYSASKTFTLYGMRCGALICVAPTKEIADEFKMVCEYSSRGSWSNAPRAGQSIISKICADEDLFREVSEERESIRSMLLRRGRTFERTCREIGLAMVPFDGGFFACIPCADSQAVCARLEKERIFLVPNALGIRVSIASISEEKCRLLPRKIQEAMA